LRTPLTRINLGDETSGNAEKPDNWIFLWKLATMAVWSGRKVYKRLLWATHVFIYWKNKILIH